MARPPIEDPERPALDNRTYRIITLQNQLEVLLIHDPNTDKANAALDVNVGRFNEADMPGIAHGVEHLLFLGTEKYPKPDGYNQFLAAHSGHSNAYTAAISANYYFELPATLDSETSLSNGAQERDDSPLWGALDRFAQFFISSLFSEEVVDRELKAIDSENKSLRSDIWRLRQLNKALSNPQHPYCHFSTGSFKTVHDDPAQEDKIRREFIKIHSEYYSADRMRLVVIGRESLDTLEEWVGETFSKVPNKDIPPLSQTDFPLFTENELVRIVRLKVSNYPKETFEPGDSRNTTQHGTPGNICLTMVASRLCDTKPTHRDMAGPPSKRPVEADRNQRYHSSIPSVPLRNTTTPEPLGLLEIQRYDAHYPVLLLQPDSRPISQEQLAAEVKSIYAGLTMVETKCIQVERAQAAGTANSSTQLTDDDWQSLIALHRTLLHEHHDFFLASQHPSASPALRRLASKYSMPARMWKHGIHSFLELLRRRLPDSVDHMLAFIYLAYQMMALLYETVPEFEDTWIECLGDLGRYRMAIEDEDVRDREIWAGVAKSWYNKAADKSPTVGRLYHHLAILARPNALQQLYYYARSLMFVKPFSTARESVLTLLEPILGRSQAPKLSTRRRRNHWQEFISTSLALSLLVPGAAAQTAEATTNPNWRQHALDKLTEILVSSAELVPAAITLLIIGGSAAALLWAEAEGVLGFFMLLTAIVFASIRPDGTSDEYIRLAVGLGFVMLMLAYCRVVTMQPKQKNVRKSERRSRKYSRLFGTIATALGVMATLIFMAFSGAREFWKGLTALHPAFALFLATPLSYFLCDVIVNVSMAVNSHDDHEILLSELFQLEAGQSSAFAPQDTPMRRFRNLHGRNATTNAST